MKKSNTSDFVYEYLAKQILAGKLHPREKLDETKISQTINVSRTPVREALKKLQAEGYITTIPKKGSFVTNYSPKEIDQIYRILSKLEGLAVALAVNDLGKDELDELQKMHERMRQFCEQNNYREYLAENVKFHKFFPHICGNTVLEDIISQLRKKFFGYHLFGITLGHLDKYVQDHEGILGALNRKEFELASKNMELHVDRVRKILLNFYENFP